MTESANLFTNTPRPPPRGHGGCPSIPRDDAIGLGREASQEGHMHEPKSTQAAIFYKYPLHAGCKEMTTSFEAACKVEEKGYAHRMRDKCLVVLTQHSMTAKEVAAYLGVSPDNTRPRCTELLKRGLIVRTGERRDGQHVLARAA